MGKNYLKPFKQRKISHTLRQPGHPLQQAQTVGAYGWVFIHYQHRFEETIDSGMTARSLHQVFHTAAGARGLFYATDAS